LVRILVWLLGFLLLFSSIGYAGEIYINLPAYRLYYLENGVVVRDFPIAIGKQVSIFENQVRKTETPQGSFRVVNKVVWPAWYPSSWLKKERGWPDNYVVPGGIENPLGSRWIGLSVPGIGIHGNNDPASIGLAVSLGCIRMYNQDVEDLYKLVLVGDRVKIAYERIDVIRYSDNLYRIGFYPDVYHKGDVSLEDVRFVVERYWFGSLLDDELLEYILEVGYLNVEPRILVNGQEISTMVWEETIYLPIRELARAGNNGIEWKAETREVFWVGKAEPLEGVLYEGRFYVTIDLAQELLSAPFAHSWQVGESHVSQWETWNK